MYYRVQLHVTHEFEMLEPYWGIRLAESLGRKDLAKQHTHIIAFANVIFFTCLYNFGSFCFNWASENVSVIHYGYDVCLFPKTVFKFCEKHYFKLVIKSGYLLKGNVKEY